MRSTDEINGEFARLCARIGEQTYRIRQLNEALADNLRRIETLEDEARAAKAREEQHNGERNEG
jgi:uncharacterized coiled-coil DUF342 family protein